MARSFKKTPISGHCDSRGMKQFKKREHRRHRRAEAQALFLEEFDHMPHKQQFCNEWDSPRDGKFYIDNDGTWTEDHLRSLLGK
jgi:hypothetical protein